MPKIHDLTPAEIGCISSLLEWFETTREERLIKVQRIMDLLTESDILDKLVAEVLIRHRLGLKYSEPSSWFDSIGAPRIVKRAPGVYMSRYVHEAVMQTGEFVDLADFKLAASGLTFNEKRGLEACDFLYKWSAARNPNSDADDDVKRYGNKSGMRHGFTDSFPTGNVLFHRSVLDEYIQAECSPGDQTRTIINPIITLVGTDDWELATSMMSPSARSRLG